MALLPAGTATFANYTSYSRGINGLMIDLAGLPPGAEAALSAAGPAADFLFRAGNGDAPDAWSAAPAPASLAVRRGAGVSGSDRVTITWADGAIKKTWLQVTVLPTADTGLASADVFYFGNAVGETGNSPADARVNALDAAVVRSRLAAAPASLSSRYDLNRDGRVGATDLLIARTSRPTTPLPLITLPVL